MIKECKKHGFTEFSKRNDGRYRCKKCAVDSVQKRRDKLKLLAVNYKGGKCQNPKCGYNKYVGALEFHHMFDDKEFGISQRGHTKSWDNLKNELNKCILLCSNCHREVHGGLLDVSKFENIKIEINVINNNNNYCECGKKISKKAKRCRKCMSLNSRKIKKRPTKEQLLEEIKNSSYLAVGKKYGVSDNTIRKWLK